VINDYLFASTYIMIGILIADIIANVIVWKKLGSKNIKVNHTMVNSL